MEVTSRAHATGNIVVNSYVPDSYDETVQPKLVEIHVLESFLGDLEGEGTARFLQVLRSDQSASFVGIERFKGTLAGRSGTFIFQDQGVVEKGFVKGAAGLSFQVRAPASFSGCAVKAGSRQISVRALQ